MSDKEKEMHAISALRWRVATLLSAAMLSIYFGFILLVAFDKPLLSTLLTDGLSLGILLGASVIVGAWVLTTIYVWWANTTYDSAVAKIKG
ncbi:MAG: DUF485 domain-containing protein [Alphaproteobacteria bacterium]|nr:DUF485 domain-containing protein [Alphaproteobacteria bacterium]